ncbi:MAG: rhomboid family intramembrane serine protease [Phycisphaerae bacterium]|nr:rhomboid family intramembrane serine protease [Phycisphaerae bacterium]
MFMLLPYNVDVPQERMPWMNWVIIAANAIVYFGWQIHVSPEAWEPYMQNDWDFSGMFTSVFMHADFMHIFGNMLFLWLFGNAVCAKLGNFLYLPIYILMGYFAGCGQAILTDGYCLGASGAINGIVGLYLIFYPLNDISCFFLLFIRPMTFTTSSGWIIGLWFLFDIVGALSGENGVGYGAHIGGFLAGAGLAILMLKKCWLRMDELEVSLLEVMGWDKGCQKKYRMRPGVDMSEGTIWHEAKPKTYAQEGPSGSKNPIMRKEGYKPEDDVIVKFECDCGCIIKMPAKFAGRKCKCSHCHEILVVPGK